MKTRDDERIPEAKDENRDPISGAPGAHPVGVGAGALAGGAAAGAAAGTVAGPVGTAVGAAVGAVAGAIAGKAVAEAVDPTAEDAFWRDNYDREPYYEQGRRYEDYEPAYRAGYETYALSERPRSFEEVERDIEAKYNARRARDGFTWEHARRPAKAAWDRVDRNAAEARDKSDR